MFRHLNITQLCGVYFIPEEVWFLITELALDEKGMELDQEKIRISVHERKTGSGSDVSCE